MTVKFRRRIIVTLTIVVAAVVLIVYYPRREMWEVKIATATRGGTYLPLGKQFARILEQLDEKHIVKAEHIETASSLDNIDRLVAEEADIAFVLEPALVHRGTAVSESVRILANLYEDMLQIVVRKNAGINSLSDLRGKRVYLGKAGSGTKLVADSLLHVVGLDPEKDVTSVSEDFGFTQAAEMLISDSLDAAIFVAGMPTTAVKKALQSDDCDCELLDLSRDREEIVANISFFQETDIEDIQAEFYKNQAKRVETSSIATLLVGRSNLDDQLAFVILDALFDNIKSLLTAHTRAEGVGLMTAFEDIAHGFELHRGASEFQEREKKKLHIVTGAIRGKYYELGQTMQTLLELRGIDSRVIHTDGSVANAKYLKDRPARTLAIMQYDVALASYNGNPESIYKVESLKGVDFPEVKKMKRIAALHSEAVHIMIRRDKLSPEDSTKATVGDLREQALRICLGPRNSGTRMIAESILRQHSVSMDTLIFHPVQKMVDKLHAGEIDCGFFVSYVPSEAVKTILAGDRIRLLSIETQKLAELLIGPVFETGKIQSETYPSQRKGESDINTIETRSVLVSTEALAPNYDVKKVTQAIFEGAAFLGTTDDSLAEVLPSVPLHPGAKEYYLEMEHLPSKAPFEWDKHMWYRVATIVVAAGLLKGLLTLRRNRISNLETRKIHEVSVDISEQHSVRNLREQVSMKWWRLNELDNSRWRELEDLIDNQINEARQNLTMALLAEIRAIAEAEDTSMNDATRLEDYNSLEKRMCGHLENGELEESQYDFLLSFIDRRRRETSHTTNDTQTE